MVYISAQLLMFYPLFSLLLFLLNTLCRVWQVCQIHFSLTCEIKRKINLSVFYKSSCFDGFSLWLHSKSSEAESASLRVNVDTFQ